LWYVGRRTPPSVGAPLGGVVLSHKFFVLEAPPFALRAAYRDTCVRLVTLESIDLVITKPKGKKKKRKI